MEEAQVPIPKSLWKIIVEEAEKKSVTPEVVTVSLLLKLAPETKKPQILLEAAKNSLQHASSHVEKGEYREALYRIWGSTLLALKALAARRGKPLPENLIEYFSTAVEEEETVSLEALAVAFVGAMLASLEDTRPETLGKYAGFAKSKAENLISLLEGY